MPSVESIIEWLQGLPPGGLYAALFAFAYIENVFPPSPSDVVMLFVATLIGIGTIGHVPSIAIATTGSTLGFLTAFLLGRRYGRRWVASGSIKFLTPESLAKVDRWFDKYGYWVIIINRFMAGTRAVVSFFAGMSKLNILKTTILCTLSALLWNVLVIELGAFVGANWREGQAILDKYGLVVMIVMGAALVALLVRWLLRRGRKAEAQDATEMHATESQAPAATDDAAGPAAGAQTVVHPTAAPSSATGAASVPADGDPDAEKNAAP